MFKNIRTIRLASAVSLALMVGLASAPAVAQTDRMESPTIAVIDMQRIMRESAAVRSIQSQVNEQRSQYQEQLRVKEQELRGADQELTRQRTILSSEAYKKKRQELEQRVGNLQREIQARKRKLDQTYGDAMRRVQQELAGIVRQIMEARGIDVVFSKTSVFLVHNDLEITEPALQRLNDQLTSVDVSGGQN